MEAPIVANIPAELLDVYRILVQNAPTEQAAQQHLVNFVTDARTVVSAIQQVLDAARGRAQAAQ